jgi:hypothetical protein
VPADRVRRRVARVEESRRLVERHEQAVGRHGGAGARDESDEVDDDVAAAL